MTFVDWCLLRSLCGLNPKTSSPAFFCWAPLKPSPTLVKLRIAFWWFGLFAPDWASKFLSRRVGALLVADGECRTCHLTTRKQVYDRYIIHIQTVIAFSEKKLVEDNSQDPLPIYNFEDIIDDGHHTVEGQKSYTGWCGKYPMWYRISSINCRLAVPRIPMKVHFGISSIKGKNPSWWSVICWWFIFWVGVGSLNFLLGSVGWWLYYYENLTILSSQVPGFLGKWMKLQGCRDPIMVFHDIAIIRGMTISNRMHISAWRLVS